MRLRHLVGKCSKCGFPSVLIGYELEYNDIDDVEMGLPAVTHHPRRRCLRCGNIQTSYFD